MVWLYRSPFAVGRSGSIYFPVVVLVTTCLRGGYRRGGGSTLWKFFALLKTDTSIPLLDTKMREKETKAKDEEQVMRSGMRVVG
jgi:hypothetical protein